jgi:hypothetical protein
MLSTIVRLIGTISLLASVFFNAHWTVGVTLTLIVATLELNAVLIKRINLRLSVLSRPTVKDPAWGVDPEVVRKYMEANP